MLDDDDVDDETLAQLIPRKPNAWIFATITGEFIRNVLRAAEGAMEDVTTTFSQRYIWEQDRREWSEEVGFEIEHIDELMGDQGATG